MPEEVSTQHLIDALDYIHQIALTRPPEVAVAEIRSYCADLIQIAKWYKDLSQYQAQYNEARARWRERIRAEAEALETLDASDRSKLKPGLIDNAC